MSIELYFLQAIIVVMIVMTIIWIVSVFLKNASIVDIFWGIGFIVVSSFYFADTEGYLPRKILVVSLTSIWGMRLAIHIAWRNFGKGEDFRYVAFRKKYGPRHYWWISYFQVFLLQGILLWLISAPLLGAQYYGENHAFGLLDILAVLVWIVGFFFEAVGDYQLLMFKSEPFNKGKVCRKGLWRYTRHPNYFGDAMVWWGFGLLSVAAGGYLPVLGSLLMTVLLLRVSGVTLLEKTLQAEKPGYREYIEQTNPFFPWFPKEPRKTS